VESIYVMLILLNIHTGEEVFRKIESGPYETIIECTKTTVGQPAEQPKDDLITIHECVISHVDKVS
jgi:hypothetical protein